MNSDIENLLTSSQEAYLGDYDELTSILPDESNFMGTIFEIQTEPLDEMINSYDQKPFIASQATIPQGCATGKLPSVESFPGTLDFSLDVQGLESEKAWSFSTKLNKVFINLGNRFPIQFKWHPAVGDLYVRAMMVYTHPNDYLVPVQRCQMHLAPGDKTNRGFQHIDHVIRAEDQCAVYNVNTDSQRMSVVVPLDQIQPGATSVTVFYSFNCKNSCPGGMNRRTTKIIFTLENFHGEVYGRQTMDVRVCSCPKRDRDKEENDKNNTTETSNGTPKQATKRPMTKTSASKKAKKNDHVYTVEVVGEDAYQHALLNALGYQEARALLEGRLLTEKETVYKEKYKSKML